jgi:release factor glutamine methyltransferase
MTNEKAHTDTIDSTLAERRKIETTVYQPAEDSALLADAIHEQGRGRLLEVGTGSGWVATTTAADVDAVTEIVASDLNPHACHAAAQRAASSDDTTTPVSVIQGDLLTPFDANSFETVAFNPPYLPTDPDVEWDDWMEHALSGGPSGREVIEPFIDSLNRVLAPDGIGLVLVSSLAGYEEVIRYIETAGFEHSVVIEESYPFETLSILTLRQQ